MRIDDFTRDKILMFISGAGGSFFNLLYQLFIARSVSRSAFAQLNSLLSLFVIISVPAMAFSILVTKHLSVKNARKEHQDLHSIWRVLWRHALIFGVSAFALALISSPIIRNFLNLGSVYSPLIFGGLLFFGCILPAVNGGMQGLQMFKWLALLSVLAGILRLLFSACFIKIIPYELDGALLGILGSMAVYIFISYIPLRFLWNSAGSGGRAKISSLRALNAVKGEAILYRLRTEEPSCRKLYSFAVPTVLVLISFSVLTNIDMILVQHFFFDKAQDYSIAQLAGKVILFLPGMVYMVIFARSAGLHATNNKTGRILTRSVIFTTIICLPAVIIFNLFPGFFLRMLVGNFNLISISLSRLLSFAMFFFALSHILFFYQLSIEKYAFIPVLLTASCLQVLAIIAFHKNLTVVTAILLVTSAAIFIFNLLSSLKLAKQKI